MTKLDLNLFLLQIIKKKNLIFLLIFFLINNCSFDNKTGIWSGSEQERSRILELEEKQNQTDSSFRKVYSSEDVYLNCNPS